MSVESVLGTRKRFRESFTSYIRILIERSNKDKLKEFSEMRNINIKAIEDADIFYVEDMAEMLVPSYLGRLQEFGIRSEEHTSELQSPS